MPKLFVAVFGLVWASMAAAASGAAAGQGSFGSGLLLTLGIAYLTRRRKIGGWLWYFYFQMYVSLVLGLLFIPSSLELLAPGRWDSANRYVWYIVSTLPVLALQYAQGVLATLLLVHRNAVNVRRVRLTLRFLALTAFAAFAIDIVYFNEGMNLFFDGLTAAFATIWTLYFGRSERVQRVFVHKDWQYGAAPEVPMPRAERAYRSKRACAVGAAVFVLLFILLGMAAGDEKPGLHLFMVPLVDGLFAAVVGWYAPIRKSKRAALHGTEPPQPTLRL